MAETQTQVVVIGAGISGIVAAKCLQDAGFEVIVLEKTDEVGGLWTFREQGYGVMRFTHINVSKQNYAFSDFPFPDDVVDFPHNKEMAQYVADYTMHFGVNKLIRFQTQVDCLEKKGEDWYIHTSKVEEDGKGGYTAGEKHTYICKYVAIATGHHAKPSWPDPKFPGQESFKGEIIHSVSYNDAITNNIVGKRVLVVGIGNSAIDVAIDAVTEGRCPRVWLSTRSGAWVVPNYLFGHPVDHYACRAFLWLPWKLGTFILETVIKLLHGNPSMYGLNPKMHALQTQPSVSPVLYHHLQRGQIKIVPNIQKIEGKTVHFTDGQSAEFDQIVLCTGYRIDLPYLADSVRSKVLDEGTNHIKLYKNVFSPEVGHTLAFIGFVQPASGGVLTMSEIQSRWFAELCKGKVKLPSKQAMEKSIEKEKRQHADRYFASARHTIQKDPILYNDDIAAKFGAKPQLWRHPTLAWRLLLSSCGASQWRLQGPNKWDKAAEEIRKVPVTGLIQNMAVLLLALFASLLLLLFIFVF